MYESIDRSMNQIMVLIFTDKIKSCNVKGIELKFYFYSQNQIWNVKGIELQFFLITIIILTDKIRTFYAIANRITIFLVF